MSLRDEFLKMQGEADKTVRRTEREIVRSYKDALDDLYNTLGRLFRKYEIDGKLTYDEMVKYGRVGKLNKKLAVTAATLYKDVSREIKGGLKGIYEIGFDKTGSILSRETGKSLTGIIRQDVLDRALTNDISGLKWTERMGLHRDHVVMKIRETVTQGLHDGATYKQMADRLNEALSGDVVNPMRIVRTEGHRVFSQSQKDRLDEAYKSGTKMTKTWISSKDERVRSTHADMEGVTVPYEEDFILPDGARGFAPGIIGAPQHDINCRCTWKIDIVDDEDEKEGGQSEDEDGIMRIDLQLFAADDWTQLQKRIQSGIIDADLFDRCFNEFKSTFKSGINTPLGNIKCKNDTFVHIAQRHPNMVDLKEIKNIKNTLQSPDFVYATQDKIGNKANSYIRSIDGKVLLVVVRNHIITAYYPSRRYLERNVLNGGELVWGKE